MSSAGVATLAVAVLVILLVARTVRIVPHARAGIVERFGRYSRTQFRGLALLVPFVDRMRSLVDLREQVLSTPPQPVRTSDDLAVGVGSEIHFQVTDPRAATYAVQNYVQAIEQLTSTVLRTIVGSLDVEHAMRSRMQISIKSQAVLDEAIRPWGLRMTGVEITLTDAAHTPHGAATTTRTVRLKGNS